MTYFIQILTGTLGAFGFAILYNLRGTKLLIATLGGALSWGTYLFFGIWFHSEPLRYFFAAIAVTIYAEIFARIKKDSDIDIFDSTHDSSHSRRRSLLYHELCPEK